MREIARRPDAGAEIDLECDSDLPQTLAVAAALGLDPLGMLASGALLIAARPDAVARIMPKPLTPPDIPIHVRRAI